MIEDIRKCKLLLNKLKYLFMIRQCNRIVRVIEKKTLKFELEIETEILSL